jgi:hypothetical protein
MLADPGVVVDRTTPGEDELSLAPAGITVLAVVSGQQPVLLEVRAIVIALAARTALPPESTMRAVMLLVDVPSAAIVAGFALRIACAIRVSNVAPTDLAASIVTVQAPMPVHAPLQLTKTESVAALWVSVTTVPAVKEALQVAPQVIPAGALVTVPPPVPLLVTLSR